MTIKIPLTGGLFALIDECDSDLSQVKWRYNIGYAVREIRLGKGRQTRTSEYLHRVVLSRLIGRPLERWEQCDHINGNRLDDRRANLRVASKDQNNLNRKKAIYDTTTSSYKGVSWNTQTQKWRAQIIVNNKNIHLGMFGDEIAAAMAYNEAAEKHFGEFAWLNRVGV